MFGVTRVQAPNAQYKQFKSCFGGACKLCFGSFRCRSSKAFKKFGNCLGQLSRQIFLQRLAGAKEDRACRMEPGPRRSRGFRPAKFPTCGCAYNCNTFADSCSKHEVYSMSRVSMFILYHKPSGGSGAPIGGTQLLRSIVCIGL